MKLFYSILVFALFAIGAIGCQGTTTTLSEKESYNLTQEQIIAQLHESSVSVQLANFDYVHSHHTDLNAYRINWSALRETSHDNEIIWEIPLFSQYNVAIIAGRKEGKLFQPFRLAVCQHILFRKNIQSGEVSSEILTFLGENTEKVYHENLMEFEGFIISSDLQGAINSTHKIHNGKITKILAGNSELQKQEKDFYCFCFEIDNKLILTKGGDDEEEEFLDTICTFCHHPLRFCTCDRCPECGNTSPLCICNTCHICGKQRVECECNTVCESCHKLKYQCMCPPIMVTICPTCQQNPCICGPTISTPEPTVCPDCHKNPCICTTPAPGECHCTNIYCLKGRDCNCRYTGLCTCPACLSGNCSCLPSPTQ
ncbi:MAG: hypothetical protein K2I90_07115 [Odoribacter sp.]|nr:hypothetical protein [Odoribacter sp.]